MFKTAILPRGHASVDLVISEIHFPPGAVLLDEAGVFVSERSDVDADSWSLFNTTYYSSSLTADRALVTLRSEYKNIDLRVRKLTPATAKLRLV